VTEYTGQILPSDYIQDVNPSFRLIWKSNNIAKMQKSLEAPNWSQNFEWTHFLRWSIILYENNLDQSAASTIDNELLICLANRI